MAQTPSSEKELALGRGLAEEVRRSTKPLGLPAADEYVQRTGARLAAAVPGQAFTFEVAKMDEKDAIGLIGGAVFVPAAALARAETEQEFVAALTHAMGHVVLRHGLMQPTKGDGIPLIFMGGWQGVHGGSGGAMLLPMAMQKEVPRYEAEADEYARGLMERARVLSATGEFEAVRDAVRAELARPARKPPTLRR